MTENDLIWEEPLHGLLWGPGEDGAPPAAAGKAGLAAGGALRLLSRTCRPPERKPVRLPSEMGNLDLKFVCGLLRRKRPEKVLEVGVAAGATSAVILKALSLLGLPAKLHSVDLFTRLYRDDRFDTGYIVAETVPELRKNWDLHTGRVVDTFIDGIGGGIDFCVLDTVHCLPGELFDFLAVLPYLKDGAIVVVHDTQLQFKDLEIPSYATCTLLSVAAAEKILIRDDGRREGLANIAAFVVSEDTRKHVANVFSALMLPWHYMPDDAALADILAGMRRHYPPSYVDFFMRAVNVNSHAQGGPRKFEPEDTAQRLLHA